MKSDGHSSVFSYCFFAYYIFKLTHSSETLSKAKCSIAWSLITPTLTHTAQPTALERSFGQEPLR